jgi:hypothetical protein
MSNLSTATAGDVEILNVEVVTTGERTYRFDVTLRHADTGWDHYADGWEILGPDGTPLGTRTLYHPHVEEQPFTRSLSEVRVPAGIDRVQVRAHDSVHGYGKRTQSAALPP